MISTHLQSHSGKIITGKTIHDTPDQTAKNLNTYRRDGSRHWLSQGSTHVCTVRRSVHTCWTAEEGYYE